MVLNNKKINLVLFLHGRWLGLEMAENDGMTRKYHYCS